MENIAKILQDKKLTSEERDFFTHQYHYNAELRVNAYHSKGQFLEKLRRYEDALNEYYVAKDFILQIYGDNN
jgi:hypothetical protein